MDRFFKRSFRIEKKENERVVFKIDRFLSYFLVLLTIVNDDPSFFCDPSKNKTKTIVFINGFKTLLTTLPVCIQDEVKRVTVLSSFF